MQNQATDRAHRIGQKNVVNVYKLIVKDTIEENILKLQEKKRELADQILEGEGLNGGSFTKEELMELLSGNNRLIAVKWHFCKYRNVYSPLFFHIITIQHMIWKLKGTKTVNFDKRKNRRKKSA